MSKGIGNIRMTIKESLNILDTKAIDNNEKFLDLRNLYEAANLNYEKKKKLKELIDRNEDPEVIAAYIINDDDKLKEALIEEDRDYPGSRYGYDYEPLFFIIVDEESNPVDTFMGTETDLENYFKDNYDSSFAVENVSKKKYFDTIDLIGMDKYYGEEIPFNESYKLRFYCKQEGPNQGDLDHEEFFDTRLEAIDRYEEVFDRNAYSLNPTMWIGDGNSWKRLNEPVIEANESLNESSKSNASLTFKNNSGALELYAYNYVDPDLSDEEAIEYKERPYWKNWYKTRSEAVEDYKIIDSICNKYNVRIWPHDNHTFNNKNEVEIVGPSKNIIKKALNELRRRYDFEMIDESLNEASYGGAVGESLNEKFTSVIPSLKDLKNNSYTFITKETYVQGDWVPLKIVLSNYSISKDAAAITIYRADNNRKINSYAGSYDSIVDKLKEFDIYEKPKKNESLNEASYGGAFDIEDDMFFTKDDLMEFGYDLVEQFSAWSEGRCELSDLYMTSPVDLVMEVSDEDGAEHQAKIKIDMRKIKLPKDIYKYSDIILKQWKDSYNEYHEYDESLNESSQGVEYLEDELADKSQYPSIEDAYQRNELTICKFKDRDVYYIQSCPNRIYKLVRREMKKYYPELTYLYDESLNEDTIKTKSGKWVNKGKEGTHGKFKTKKEADAQRKAMFASGYRESLDEDDLIEYYGDEISKKYNSGSQKKIDKWLDRRKVDSIGDLDLNGLRELAKYVGVKTKELDEAKIVEPKYRDGDVVFIGDASGYQGTFLIEGDFRNIPEELYSNIRQIKKYGNTDDNFYLVEYNINSKHLFEEDYKKFFDYVTPLLNTAGISIVDIDELAKRFK